MSAAHHEEKAGRELDARVAVEVMGWEPVYVPLDPPHLDYYRTGGLRRPCGWSPSTDIAAAWAVVERLGATPKGFAYADGFALHYDGKTWEAGWREDDLDHGPVFIGRAYAEADTAPLAICLAALAAVRASTTNREREP